MRATLKILIVGMVILFQLSSCFLDEPISYRVDSGSGSEGNSNFCSTRTSYSSSLSATLSGVSEVAVGDTSTCALLNDGTVACWGSGYGSTPTKISGITTATSIDVGYDACALLSNGTVECWRGNSSPNQVPGISSAIDLDVSLDFKKCVVLADCSAKCFDNSGETHQTLLSNVNDAKNIELDVGEGLILNNDNSVMLFTPTSPAQSIVRDGWTAVRSISASWASNLLVNFYDGTIQEADVWNFNWQAVPNINTAVQVSASFWINCSVLNNGSVKCWDANNFRGVSDYDPYLGNGAPDNLTDTPPVIVSGINNAVYVDVGGYNGGGDFYAQACAILNDGSVKCWGDNSYGQLGDGTTTDRSTPVTVKGL